MTSTRWSMTLNFSKCRLSVVLIPFLLMLSSCVGPKVVLKKDVPIHTLGVNLEIAPYFLQEVSDGFEMQLDNFIEAYNADLKNRYTLTRAKPNCSTCVTIKIEAMQLVTKGQQTTGVLVSMAGLSLPFVMVAAGSPIFVWFYYFPTVRSLTTLSLSEDLDGAVKPRKPFVYQSPGFLRGHDKQIKKHVSNFHHYLSYLLNDVEKQYNRNDFKKMNLALHNYR